MQLNYLSIFGIWKIIFCFESGTRSREFITCVQNVCPSAFYLWKVFKTSSLQNIYIYIYIYDDVVESVLKVFTRVWKRVCTFLSRPQPSERVVTGFLVYSRFCIHATRISSPASSWRIRVRLKVLRWLFIFYFCSNISTGLCCKMSAVGQHKDTQSTDSTQHSATGLVPVSQTLSDYIRLISPQVPTYLGEPNTTLFRE